MPPAVQIIEIDGESLDAAQEEASARRPNGPHRFEEEVLFTGGVTQVRGVAKTMGRAFERARAKLPASARIIEEREYLHPQESLVDVYAPDEVAARIQASKTVDLTATVGVARLKEEARKGFFRGKPPLFEVQVDQPAVAEIVFDSKPTIRVTIEAFPDRGYCQVCGADGSVREIEGGPVTLSGGRTVELRTRHYYACSGDCLSVMLDPELIILTKLKYQMCEEALRRIVLTPGASHSSEAFLAYAELRREKDNLAREHRSLKQGVERIRSWHCWACRESQDLERDTCAACGRSRLFTWQPDAFDLRKI